MKQLIGSTSLVLGLICASSAIGSPTQGPPMGDEIPLAVGRSVVLDHPDEIERVAINDDSIADAIAISTREVLIHGKSPGITTLIIWSASGDRNFFTISVAANTEQLQEHINAAFPGENVRVILTGNVATVNGDVSSAAIAERVIAMARAMRTGHAFSVSLEMLHKEFSAPLSDEFKRAFEEQNLGLPLEVALERLAVRVPLLDVKFFVSSVLLQKRTGGNLASLLENLSYLIRERFKLRGRIRSISAHCRISGLVLSMIPLTVALLMFWTNPEYVLFFFDDPDGKMLMVGSIILQFLGFVTIKKLTDIEV